MTQFSPPEIWKQHALQRDIHIIVFVGGHKQWWGYAFIHSHSLRFNTVAYIKCLKKVVLFWVKTVTARRPYAKQQDSVSSYINRRTQSWLSETFANTPPLKYLTPQIVIPLSITWEAWLNEGTTMRNTKIDLKTRITAVFTTLNKKTIRKAYRKF